MTRATLSEVLQPAWQRGYAVPGFVCLGWEDTRAVVTAAAAEQAPVILQAGPGCRAHTPLPVIAAMFRHLADSVSVPVVLHLDHGRSMEEIKAAIAEGFTSVMYDGSALPLEENIRSTAAIVRLARQSGVSCEGEIGFVGYAGGEASRSTDPGEAARFAEETGLDAMAVAAGNVHLQTEAATLIDEQALAAIRAASGGKVPLVIHGGSGVPDAQRASLARTGLVAKFNIGTELRQIFGKALRASLQANTAEFDRIRLLGQTEAPLVAQARHILRNLGASGAGAQGWQSSRHAGR
jgi:fructose-bisphosphate aldolase class II